MRKIQTCELGAARPLPAPCSHCPWLEKPRGRPGCLNFKKLLCRLAPAAVLDRFFNFLGPR